MVPVQDLAKHLKQQLLVALVSDWMVMDHKGHQLNQLIFVTTIVSLLQLYFETATAKSKVAIVVIGHLTKQ